VVRNTFAHHDIKYPGIGTRTTGHTRVDHKVGSELAYKLHCGKSGVNLPDTRFHYDERMGPGVAQIESDAVDDGGARLRQQRQQQLQLLVHSHNNCYCHG
jgi:hypothetical protein